MSQFKGSSLAYRPEIDGLRGLAVLLVVLFHLELDIFTGGFIGVDVFFVISGYLITQSIVNEFSKGKFTLINFFHRRVLRIFPALFVFVVLVGLSSLLIFNSERIYAQLPIMVYVLIFIPNLYFGQQTNYSSFSDGLSPYFHTWSLGVEEQFYLFWPFFLLLLFKVGKSRLQFFAILCLVVISFWMREKFSDSFPLFSFHSPVTRVWEIAIGGAFVYIPRSLQGRVGSLLSVYVGLLMILWASLVLEIHTKVDGFYALLPVFGSLLCISASSRFYSPLKAKPLVVLGKISFSLYLLHWPIIVFFKETVGEVMSSTNQLWILVLSLLLAYLSWRFVEMPFLGLRSKDRVMQIKTIVGGLASIAALCLIILIIMNSK